MLFVVLIYRNKIIRVCPWFYFFILGRFMLDGLYLLYLLIDLYISSVLEMEYLGLKRNRQLLLTWIFFLGYSELIYLFVCSNG